MAKHLTLVVAMDANRGIGFENKLPWHIPEDLAFFKKMTIGRPMIMGRRTFDSLGRPLPQRRNIVVTRNPEWKHEGVEVARSLDEAIAMVGNEAANIIGGAQIFEQSMDIADRLVVTHIDKVYTCDTFFPVIDHEKWTAVSNEPLHSEKGNVDFAFVTYDKVK